MLKQWRGFIAGVIFTLTIIALTSTVFAAVKGTNITVYYDNIKIFLNGKEIETKDVNGDDAKPFIYKDTVYVPIRAVSKAFNKIVDWDSELKQVKIYEAEIEQFWDNLVQVPENYTGLDIYWRYIDDDIMDKADAIIDKYGADVLFAGLKSANPYSQYYCINRLVEYYNSDDIRTRAITEITPFLNSTNNTLKHGAEFAISVLSKKFDSKYIVSGANDIKIFALFNDYSDYGSFNELWIIRADKLSKLYSFRRPDVMSTHIDTTEPIKFSPDKNKIAVQTCNRRSSTLNIIDLNSGKIISGIMELAVKKVAADNKDYINTYPDGLYCWCRNFKWIDNNTIEFEADLAYDYMEIIENVIVKYNISDNSLEYKKQTHIE